MGTINRVAEAKCLVGGTWNPLTSSSPSTLSFHTQRVMRGRCFIINQ